MGLMEMGGICYQMNMTLMIQLLNKSGEVRNTWGGETKENAVHFGDYQQLHFPPVLLSRHRKDIDQKDIWKKCEQKFEQCQI